MAENNNNNNNSKEFKALTVEQRETNEKLDQLIEVNDPTGARQTETRNEQNASRKKELNYLKSMAAGITGLGKYFKGLTAKVPFSFGGFLKKTLMAVFLVALLAFLNSKYWQQTKDFITGPLFTGLKWVAENILEPIGRTFEKLIDLFEEPTKKKVWDLLKSPDTWITVGSLLLLLAPRTMFGLLLKGVPLLVAAFAALGKHLMRMITPLDKALPVAERAAMKASEQRGKSQRKFQEERKAEKKRLKKQGDDAKSRRSNARLEAAAKAREAAKNARIKAFTSTMRLPGSGLVGSTPGAGGIDLKFKGTGGAGGRMFMGDPYLRGDPGLGKAGKPAGAVVRQPGRVIPKAFKVARFAGGLAKSLILTGGLNYGPSQQSLAGSDIRNKQLKKGAAFLKSDKGKKFRLVLKILQRVAWPAYVALTGFQATQILGSDESSDAKAKKLGILFGGFLGAMGGAALGSIFGASMGVGALGIGAVLGGFLGGIVGGFAGHYAGEFLGEQIMRLALGEEPETAFTKDMKEQGEVFANMKHFGRMLTAGGTAVSGLAESAAFRKLMAQTGMRGPQELKEKYQARTASTRALAQRFIAMKRGAAGGQAADLRKKYKDLFDDNVRKGRFEELRLELGQDIEAHPELRQQFRQIDSIFGAHHIGLYGGGTTFIPRMGTSMKQLGIDESIIDKLSADEAHVKRIRADEIEHSALRNGVNANGNPVTIVNHQSQVVDNSNKSSHHSNIPLINPVTAAWSYSH